jgi:hypothetical protein
MNTQTYNLAACNTYEVVFRIFRAGATINTAVVVVQSTGPNWPNCEFWVLLQRFVVTA